MTADSAVARMLEARSVAVVGASGRGSSFGAEMLRTLQEGAYEGTIYPVNPRYKQIAGLTCYESLEAVGGPVDLVLLGVGVGMAGAFGL